MSLNNKKYNTLHCSEEVWFPQSHVRIIFKMESKNHPKNPTSNKPGIASNWNETGDSVSFQTHKAYKIAMHPTHPRAFHRDKTRVLKGVFQKLKMKNLNSASLRRIHMPVKCCAYKDFRDKSLFQFLLLEWFYFAHYLLLLNLCL